MEEIFHILGTLKLEETVTFKRAKRAESVVKSQTSIKSVPIDTRRDRIYTSFGLTPTPFARRCIVSSLNVHQ